MSGTAEGGGARRALLRRATGDSAACVALLLAIALQVWILARAAFLPFVDLPQHIALAELLGHRHLPAIAQLFEVRLFPQVNILHLLIAAPLLEILPEASAVRLVLALYVAGMGAGLWALARALRTSPWNAVLGLLFTVHFNLMYGFMSFCLGIPLLLFLLARLAAAPPPRPSGGGRRWRRCAVDAALWLLLVLAHLLVWLFAICVVLLRAALAGRAGARAGLVRLLAAVPAALLVAGWAVASRLDLARLAPAAASGAPAARRGIELLWHGPGRKLELLGWSLDVMSRAGWVEWTVLAAVAGTALALLLAGARRRARGGAAAAQSDTVEAAAQGDAVEAAAQRARRWLRAAALMALLCYALLPSAIADRSFWTYGVFLLYNRFLIFAPLVLLPTLVWPARPAARLALVILAITLHAGSACNWNAALTAASASAAGLDGAIDAIPPGKRVKSLIYTPFPAGLRFESLLHAASYYQARKLGEVDQSFALLPVTPVHYRQPDRPYLSKHDEHVYPDAFDWRFAPLYDAILIYDRDGAWSRYYARVPLPRLYERDGWIVLDVRGVRGSRRR